MQNRQQKTSLIITGVLVLLIISGCASLFLRGEPPRINIVSLNLQEATLFEQNYLIQLRIINPNTYEIPVAGLQYDIEVNNRHFITGVSNQSVVVPGLDSAIVEVKAVSTLFSVFRQLSNLHEDIEAISYQIKGKIHLQGGGSLGFDHSGDAPLSKMGFTPSKDKAAP